MSFLANRSSKLESFIFNEVNKRPNSICLSIVFLDNEDSPIVYKLYENKYKKAYLNTLVWGEEKWIYDLTWEEKKKISQNLTFVNPENEDKWLVKKRRSILLIIHTGVHRKINGFKNC